jgi:hypothetical protein
VPGDFEPHMKGPEGIAEWFRQGRRSGRLS